jgi:hypothetical protein
MTEPERNDGPIHAVREQLHRRRVSQDMRADALAGQGGAPHLCGLDVSRDEPFDRIAAERGPADGRKQRVRWLRGAFAQPRRQHADHPSLQRRTPLLAAFAFAAQVGPRSQHDVATAQMNKFGHPQPGLDGE